jgi:DNA-binding transcriptional LysR family regulator
LLKDPLRWLGSALHPLAQRDKVGLRSLRSEQFIVMRRGAIRDLIDPVLRAIHPALPLIEVDQQSTLVGMVAAGLGVSLLPSLSCQASGDARTVHKELAFGDHHRMIDVTRNRQRDLMPSAIAFFQLLTAHLQAHAEQLGDGVQLQAFTERQAAEFLQSP